ncbi:MAG: C40 family peptidase [Actinomycetota bacterium]|nr:C40 family peptidase [Actinomycetota bacterium]
MRFRTRVAVMATSVLTVVGVVAAGALASAQAAETTIPAVDAVVTEQATAAPFALEQFAMEQFAIVEATLDPMALAAPVDVTAKAALLLATTERTARQQAIAARIAKERERQQRIAKLRVKIVTLAKKQLGDRYSAGMSGPNAFDCSGFTRYVYKQVTGRDLPHSSRVQYTVVKKIKLRHAKPGDLIFFLNNGAHHVGIYLGKGRMVDAAGYGKGVKISPISGDWWSRSYTGVGRLLPA